MKLKIYQVVLLCAFVLLGTVAATAAVPTSSTDAKPASDYPNQPIHLIVPYPAGGGADFWGQLAAKKLSEQLGQPIIIDNHPGEGGNIGTTIASKAKPDGYTLLFGSVGPLAVHPYTYESLEYDAFKDFAPIALLESSPLMLLVHPTVKADSLKALIALAKEQPGKLTYSSNGNGSPPHVAGELFKKLTGANIKHVPYEGAGHSRKALVAGEVTMMFDVAKASLGSVQQGTLNVLAVFNSTRLAAIPDTPTLTESGFATPDMRVWTGIFAPVGTPPEIVKQLNAAVQEILSMPDVLETIAGQGGEPGATTPEEFVTYVKAEQDKWSKLTQESGVEKVPGTL